MQFCKLPCRQPTMGVTRRLLACAVTALLAHTATAALMGVTYAPYEQFGPYCKNTSQITQDANIMFANTKRVRTYALACSNSTQVLLQAAYQKSLATKSTYAVLVGFRIGDTQTKIDNEFVQLSKLLEQWGSIKPSPIYSLCVGNEYFTSGGDINTFLTVLGKARAMVAPYGIQITTAELPGIWTGNSNRIKLAAPNVTTDNSTYYDNCITNLKLPNATCAILARIDWVGVQAHPFFSSLPVTCDGLNITANLNRNITGCYNASTWVVNTTNSIYAKTKKWPRITEVGWPTDGEKCCQKNAAGFPSNATFLSIPNTTNAAMFKASLEAQAAKSNLVAFHFAAFDADWKRTYSPCMCTTLLKSLLDKCDTYCEYEYHWGLMYSNNTAKPDIPMIIP